MRKKRKIYGVMLLVFALLIMQIPVSEADAATSASDFQIDGTTLVKYTGNDSKVKIPSKVDTIAAKAFENNTSITEIQIPDNVTSIGEYAFWGCSNLKNLTLGKGLTEIQDYTFTQCKGLTSVVIPDNITRIGILAFADCVNLTDIIIPPETREIHDTAFDGCVRLVIHAEPGSVAEEYIPDFVVKQSEMPEYEDIEDYQPQEDDSEQDSSTGSSTEENDSTDNDSQTDTPPEVLQPSGTVLGSTQVVGNRAMVFIDNTSQQVTTGAPVQMPQTEGVIIDENLPPVTIEKGGDLPKYTMINRAIIADQAYYRDKELSSVTLPAGLQEIGQFSFARSTVSQISLPEGLQKIGYGAFYHCDSLQYVEIPKGIQCIEPKAFEHTAWVKQFMKNGTSDYLISGDVLIAYRGSSAKPMIPEGVRLIAADAMANHTEITEITLPDSLEIIGESAFEGCTGLSQVNGGINVKEIKDRAFSGCPLATVRIVDSVKKIGLGAFDSSEVAVFHGTQLPVSTYETSATRLSNDNFRRSALDGVSLVVVDSAIDREQLVGSVLSSELATYQGIICSMGNDNQLHCRYSNLTEEELLRVEIPDAIVIYGNEYQIKDKDKIESLAEEYTPITPGLVQVTGSVAWVQATLAGGTSEGFELRIEEASDIQTMEQAYQRIYHSTLPVGSVVYDMTLLDKQRVPVTKLGKQQMTITLPLPAVLQNQDIQVLTVDRNGQLEMLSSQLVQTDNGLAVRFVTDHFSPFAFYGKGTMYTEVQVIDGQAVVTNYGKKDDTPDTGDLIHPKWFLGFGLLFVAIAMIVSKDSARKKLAIAAWKQNKK